MNRKTLFAAGLLAVSAFAAADHNWHLESHYSFSVDPAWGPSPITNIIAMMEGGSVNDSYGWGSKAWAFSSGSSPITLTFDTDWFDLNAAEPTLTGSLMVGIVQDLPNDPPGQKHAVLFMDSQSAANIDNIAWGTVFNTTLEENLIDAIENATSGGSWEEIEPYMQMIDNFVQGEGKHGHMGPGGTEGSAWFGPNQGFSIVAFSDAKTIGTGVSSYETIQQPVPEPATMLTIGVGIATLLRRRRN